MDSVAKGMFALLDEKFDGIATEKGLCSSHGDMQSLEEAVTTALQGYGADPSCSFAAVKDAWSVFYIANEQHLKEEEGVMMPKVQAMAKNGVNLTELMASQIMPAALHHCQQQADGSGGGTTSMVFFVGFTVRTLETMESELGRQAHGVGRAGGVVPPKVRVFLHALSAMDAATAAGDGGHERHWTDWHAAAKCCLSYRKYAAVAHEIGMPPAAAKAAAAAAPAPAAAAAPASAAPPPSAAAAAAPPPPPPSSVPVSVPVCRRFR